MPRERLRKETEGLLKSFLEEVKSLAPKCVILFGSYARGDFTEGSDIDLCVIAENLPKNELARRCLTGLYSTPKIRAIGFYPEEFLKYLTGLRFLAYDIVAEGKPIYDNGFFSEIKRVYSDCLKKYGISREEKGWRITLIKNKT
ncbi:MAG: nucleotidyltransferase domain-containing protein [Candidatus Bathyarchaeia archaeon]